LGFAAERSSAERIQGLTDEQKQYDAIDQRLNKRLELADKISNQSLKAAAIQDANALAEIEKRNLTIKLTEEQGKKEADLATQREKDAAAELAAMEKIREAQQKRFNELYDAEVKSQEQMQKRIDAELKAEEAKAARKQELQQNLDQAKKSQNQNRAEQAGSLASSMSGGSASRGGGRPTSYELGLQKQTGIAFQKGRTEAADAEMQRTIDQIKQERAAAGDTRFTGKTDAMNRMADEAIAAAKAQGKASSSTNEMAKSVETARFELESFSKEIPQVTQDYGFELGKGMSELVPEFDRAQNGVDDFSKGLTENSGNMIDDFLKTGKESGELGKDFNKTSDEVNKFGEAVKKATPAPSKGGGTRKGSESNDALTKIHDLLEDNLKEMRTYAFVK